MKSASGKSLKNVYEQIRALFGWTWAILWLSLIAVCFIFMQMVMQGLADKIDSHAAFFEQSIRHAKSLTARGQKYSDTVFSRFSLDLQGKVIHAEPEWMKGLNIDKSGLFRKIRNLKPGQIYLMFAADYTDMKGRAHFILRTGDVYEISTFSSAFFFLPADGVSSVYILDTRGICMYASDAGKIGSIFRPAFFRMESGRIFISGYHRPEQADDLQMIVSLNISAFFYNTLSGFCLLLFIFIRMTVQTEKCDKKLLALEKEFMQINEIVLSAIPRLAPEKTDENPERVMDSIWACLKEIQDIDADYLENRQFLSLLLLFGNHALHLLRMIQENAAVLKEKEEHFKTVADFTFNWETWIGPRGDYKYISPACKRISGIAPEEFIRRPGRMREIIHPDDRHIWTGHSVRDSESEKTDSLIFRILTPRGEEKWIDHSCQPVFAADGRFLGRRASNRDISRQKELEDRLFHIRRLESISTLAGGVAHNFNNILMGIQGRISLLLRETCADHPWFLHLQAMDEYTRSASRLIQQLLGVAGSGKYETVPTDINELLQKQNRQFSLNPKHIRIHEDTDADLPLTEADRTQLEQVFLNLYTNAVQAMPRGGEMFIRTRQIVLEKKEADDLELSPGNYLKISLEDTGIGMDKVTCTRIFDPFFSTKEVGQGTGLGLPAAFGIIRNHKGSITVKSQPGRGSVFDILLPVSEKTVGTEKAERKRSAEKQSHTEKKRILLVDDEEIVREVTAEMLRAIGYEIIPAAGGREALDIFAQHQARIDAVILDMIMPDMNGDEVFYRLKAKDENVKVILSSGYSIDSKTSELMEKGCKGFMQKPFNLKTLTAKIAEVTGRQEI